MDQFEYGIIRFVLAMVQERASVAVICTINKYQFVSKPIPTKGNVGGGMACNCFPISQVCTLFADTFPMFGSQLLSLE